MIAGGLSFTVFSLISEKLKGIPFLYKCILGSLTVTLIELVFGFVFNLGFGFNVWDYSNIPLNFFGQICLLFSVLWGFLCIVAVPISGIIIRFLQKRDSSL